MPQYRFSETLNRWVEIPSARTKFFGARVCCDPVIGQDFSKIQVENPQASFRGGNNRRKEEPDEVHTDVFNTVGRVCNEDDGFSMWYMDMTGSLRVGCTGGNYER